MVNKKLSETERSTKKLKTKVEKLKKLNLTSNIHNLTPPKMPEYKEIANLELLSEANGVTILRGRYSKKCYAIITTKSNTGNREVNLVELKLQI